MRRLFPALICLVAACVTPTPPAPEPPDPEPSPPPAPTWSSAAQLSLATEHGSVTPMPDGTLLLVGGYVQVPGAAEPHAITEVRLFDPSTGAVRALAPLPERRAFHSAHLLPGGRVGIVGGVTREPGQRFDFTPRTYVYDFATNTWAKGPDLHAPRLVSANVTLPDGRVLLTGGTSAPLFDMGLPPTAEIVDFTHNTVTSFPIPEPRYQHTATLLPGGEVLIIGGRIPDGPISTATTYAPTATTWRLSPKDLTIRPGPKMATPRARHAAALLPDGSILVSGGVAVSPQGKRALGDFERFASDAWTTETCTLPQGRLDHVLVPTPEGHVTVVGGADLMDVARLETFAWRAGDDACPEVRGALKVGRKKGLWAGVVKDGRVMVIGGSREGALVEAQ